MMPNTEKCEKYWPDQGMTNKYGEVGLENLEEITDGGFKVRKLIVISNAECWSRKNGCFHCHRYVTRRIQSPDIS
ncbi:tyrosine-protein phosphatase 27-like isoform X2 [Styela clava]